MEKKFDPTRVDAIAAKMRAAESETASYATSQLKPIFQSHAARKPRPDALQQVIIEIVRSAPDISKEGLLRKLKKRASPDDVIRAITPDDKINWVTRKGAPKESPVSGLKDRLCRAKAHLKK